jgi:hypothetical protein
MRLSSTQLEGSEPAAPTVRFADEAHQRGSRPPRPGSAARRAEAGAFAELLGLLEWSDETCGRRTRAALERTHLEAVAGRLNSRLPAHVLLELEALPDDAYLTLVRSPEVFHAAFAAPPHELAPAMQRLIAVERARLGAATRLDGAVRAAGCDRVVRAERGVVVAIDELPRLDPGGPGPRPVLDTASELPMRLVDRSAASLSDRMLLTPSELETSAARDKLEQAWALLRQVSPLAHQLVGDLTQVVCVRTALEDPRCTAASDATTIGVVHFNNAHLPRKLPCEVASELVHETIRQAMFRWELRHPLLADRHVATAKVRSPWMGEVLDVHAMLRACFVWYGVANLWRLPSAPDELAVLRLRRAAEAGFAQRPLERLGRHRHALSVELQAAIEEMTEDVAPI